MSKKLKILTASDLHGNMDIAKKLSEKAKKNKVDLVILAGDITGREEDDGRILSPFLEARQKVAFVPGNWDSRKEHLAMRKKAKSVDKYYVTYGDVGIGGIGNEDWNFNLDEEDFKSVKKNFDKMKIGGITQWDSLANMNLLMALEQAYSIRLSLVDMTEINSIEKIKLKFLKKNKNL